MNSRGNNNLEAKLELDGGTNNNNSKFSRTTPSSSRQWASTFKNPRIVRVSRAFGGKDRHSKVCTIRGLRDRRIRLSVPTAIQLYDLQHRLGLSQPSKVVDWLIEATKHDIDQLPPLQIPPGYFNRFHQPPLFSSQDSLVDPSMKIDHFDASNLRRKSKLIDMEGKNKSIASNEQLENDEIGGYNMPQLSAQSFFPLGNSYYQWEPSSNLSLAQFGPSQIENSQTSFPLSLASSLSFPSGSQLYLNPTAATFQPVVPSYNSMTNYPLESDPTRQLNHFHHVLPNPFVPTLNLINSSMKPFCLNDDTDDDHDSQQ